MVASAVFIMDSKGKIIISRDYRGDVPGTVIAKFNARLQESDESELKPVFTIDGVTFIYVKTANLIVLAVSKRNSNVTVVLLFLNNLLQVLNAYFRKVTEETIRDNFVLTYELLDEMMDFGYPQSTEAKILKEYIKTKKKLLLGQKRKEILAPPASVTNAVSWRSEGIRHPKNEIFLDVVESLNLMVASDGTVLHSEIMGAVKMRSFLSGMPELKLGLNDKLMFRATGRRNMLAKTKAVELEDIQFHQCVRLARFENDRTISFIPPDGEFDLMTYRLSTHVKPLIWVETLVEPHRGRIEYMIKAKSQFKSRSIANSVEIRIPVPPDVDSPSFKAGIGHVTYVPDEDCIMWSIKQFYGTKEYLMRAHFGLPSITTSSETDSWKAPITVKFEIPYFTVSGIQVRYLKIIEKSGYQALPWVRYITKNGKYELRMT